MLAPAASPLGTVVGAASASEIIAALAKIASSVAAAPPTVTITKMELARAVQAWRKKHTSAYISPITHLHTHTDPSSVLVSPLLISTITHLHTYTHTHTHTHTDRSIFCPRLTPPSPTHTTRPPPSPLPIRYPTQDQWTDEAALIFGKALAAFGERTDVHAGSLPVAAVYTPTATNPSGVTWNCGKCKNANNDAGAIKCSLCLAPKPGGVEKQPRPPRPPPVTYEKHLDPASGYVYNINPRTQTTHWDGERDEEVYVKTPPPPPPADAAVASTSHPAMLAAVAAEEKVTAPAGLGHSQAKTKKSGKPNRSWWQTQASAARGGVRGQGSGALLDPQYQVTQLDPVADMDRAPTAAAPRFVKVRVPGGFAEGQSFRVDVGGGQQMMVTCPAGSAPGSEVEIQVDESKCTKRSKCECCLRCLEEDCGP